jgi:hypothetical protein
MGASSSSLDKLRNDESLLIEKLKETPVNAKKKNNSANSKIQESLLYYLKALYAKEPKNFHYIMCCVVKNKLSDEDLKYFSKTLMPDLIKINGGDNTNIVNSQNSKKKAEDNAKAAKKKAVENAKAAQVAKKAVVNAQVAKKLEAKKNDEKTIKEVKQNIRILKVLVSNNKMITDEIIKILAK